MTVHVGILGGTGPEGRGLGARLAAAGMAVTLGSRDAGRAEAAAATIRDSWPDLRLDVRGGDNAVAAGADLVVVATPWDAVTTTAQALAEQLADKVVVCIAAPLVKIGRSVRAVVPPRGSVAGELQAALPASHVAASFHHLAAEDLADLDEALLADVLVCADHRGAKDATMALVDSVEGLRALDAGTLANAGPVEAFTAVCIGINIRYKVRSTLRLGGL